MSTIKTNMLKPKPDKAKNPRLLKIAAGVVTLVSLLTLSVITHSGCTSEQPELEPAFTGGTPAVELPAVKPYTPDAATSGKSLVYVKPDKVASPGKLLSFTIAADDPDGDNLFYSASALPEGSTFDADTQTFSWTPRYDQAGTYSVHFEVTDGEYTDSEDIVITVTQLYDNWDVNGDGAADVLDMVLVGQHWGESGLTGWILEDTNEDGNVDVLDIIIIGQHWTE
jgi:hypothetical protein